jgi:hypothetical protein
VLTVEARMIEAIDGDLDVGGNLADGGELITEVFEI